MQPHNSDDHSQHRDPAIWELARKRASFRPHLATYIVINIFLWGVWYFSGGSTNNNGLPWAVWPTFGWGLGLLFHYLGAFVFPRADAVEEEYQKLIKSRK